MSFEERRELAVDNKGYVLPGLKDEQFEIVSIEHHPFNTHQGSKDLKKECEAYMARTGQLGEMTDQQTNGKGIIGISKSSVNEIVQKALASNMKDVTLSAMCKLRELIAAGRLVEIHPDYNAKTEQGNRDPRRGYNDRLIINRIYSAVRYNGKVYPAKLTIKQILNEERQKAYNAEVLDIVVDDNTRIEPPRGQRGKGTNASAPLGGSSISGSKLLENIGKSYERHKKVLDESENKRRWS